MSAPAYIARISPQVAAGSQCIPIDPPGPDEWDCTAFLTNGNANTARVAHVARGGAGEEQLDQDDMLANDPAAPEWVKRHVQDHPFDIYVRVQAFCPACGHPVGVDS